MDRLYRPFRCGVVVVLLASLAGCPASGPKTVPVNGTLNIDGKPANSIGIDFVPVETGVATASGSVEDGQFTLFSGVEGKQGAMPGKYKVVLRDMDGSAEAAAALYKAGGDAASRKPKPRKPPFPEKYLDSRTSDKEVEVPPGGGSITIEISSGAQADSTSE